MQNLNSLCTGETVKVYIGSDKSVTRIQFALGRVNAVSTETGKLSECILPNNDSEPLPTVQYSAFASFHVVRAATMSAVILTLFYPSK